MPHPDRSLTIPLQTSIADKLSFCRDNGRPHLRSKPAIALSLVDNQLTKISGRCYCPQYITEQFLCCGCYQEIWQGDKQKFYTGDD